MPYDPNLDKSIYSKSWENDLGGKITVSVYSYNNGPKKLQLSRENRDQSGELKFVKLGRLSKAEIENILPFIQDAIKILD